MAVHYTNVQVIAGSAGRTATGTAVYRAGQRITIPSGHANAAAKRTWLFGLMIKNYGELINDSEDGRRCR